MGKIILIYMEIGKFIFDYDSHCEKSKPVKTASQLQGLPPPQLLIYKMYSALPSTLMPSGTQIAYD